MNDICVVGSPVVSRLLETSAGAEKIKTLKLDHCGSTTFLLHIRVHRDKDSRISNSENESHEQIWFGKR